MNRLPPSIIGARGAQRGFVLVAVLWILVALATFVGVYSVYVAGTATGAAARQDGFRAQGLATAAVELAALKLLSVPVAQRPASGQIVFQMGKARVEADFRGEKARIDLNGASRELLAGLFAVLGATPEDAGRHADRILAWRAPEPGTEAADDYRDAGLDYGPRGGPFVHTQEIWRVPGLPPALVAAALPVLTVYNGRSEINLDTADPLVRAAMERAASLAEANSDLQSPASSDEEGAGKVAAAAGSTKRGGDAVRVRVRIRFDSGRESGAEAVILLNEFEDAPYRVLTWRDDIDPSPPRPLLSEARP